MRNNEQNRKFQKFHIKKGDTVLILSGDEKGKKGKVLEVITKKSRAIVEGLNIVTKHVKPSQTNPEGGFKKMEAGIHVSNLMLVDPKTGEATRTGKKLDQEGKLKRYSKKTNQFVD